VADVVAGAGGLDLDEALRQAEAATPGSGWPDLVAALVERARTAEAELSRYMDAEQREGNRLAAQLRTAEAEREQDGREWEQATRIANERAERAEAEVERLNGVIDRVRALHQQMHGVGSSCYLHPWAAPCALRDELEGAS
jgi:chromosome segregation ATPase